MSQAPQFVISEFTNPSGEIVFRLTGWLDGKRIRKNFPTRAEAAFQRFTGAAKSLSFYLEYALTNYRAPEREITVEASTAAYLATKQLEHKRGLLSAC